jgi:hypothetical protein
METVRSKEQQAERLAHLLDDVIRLPNTTIRFGFDPIVGLVPVVGDVLAVAAGAAILVIARQLRVPFMVLIRMAYNLLLNGIIGAFPFFGDVYSFWFKSHAKNTALLLRTVARGREGARRLNTPTFTFVDLSLVVILMVPIVAMVGFVSLWLWEREVSLITFLFF